MANIVTKTSYLEKFGLYYLKQFSKNTNTVSALPTDAAIQKYTQKLLWNGYCLITIVSIVCVWPMIKADVYWQNTVWYVHYGYVALFTIGFTIIEFYLLFLITLWLVHQQANFLGVHTLTNHYATEAFSLLPILSRSALEVQEPILHNVGINPFKQINKTNILLLGILYKLKIILTNAVLKYALLFTIGKEVFGISILYIALPVEIFWNIVILRRLVKESRIRIFGYRLAQHIVQKEIAEKTFIQFSNLGKETILRAIGNAVVFAQNYHPNMMVLYLSFKEMLSLNNLTNVDDWELFIKNLQQLPLYERNAVLDTLCIAAAFDGKFSTAENEHLGKAFGLYTTTYLHKIKDLNHYLTTGQIHKASALTDIDYVVG